MAPGLIPLTAKSMTRSPHKYLHHQDAPEQFFLMSPTMQHCSECYLIREIQEGVAQRDSTRGANNLVGGESRDEISEFRHCHIRG